MKILNLVLILLVLSLALTGCVEHGLKSEESADSIADSPEEGEISSGLEDLDDLESLEKDLEEDLGLEELEELDY